MIAVGLPKSPRKRVALLILGLFVVAWLSGLAIELGVELRLRLKGIGVWHSCGRATGLDSRPECSLGDSDMELVTWLGGLERLDITYAKIGSQSIDQVRKLRHLTFLQVRPEQITPEQKRELERDLPRLEIRYRTPGDYR